MSTTEKFSLKWNDFQNNITSTFQSLREDSDFADVTLACQDGQQVKAHKVILSASSPFFKNLLKINTHPHPLIVMKGIKVKDLAAIVDFIYFGETQIYQEHLDTFLGIAEDLKLKGLSGEEHDNADDEKVIKTSVNEKFNNSKLGERNSAYLRSNENHIRDFKEKVNHSNPSKAKIDAQLSRTYYAEREEQTLANIVALPNSLAGDMSKVNEQINSMMVASQNTITRKNGRIDKAFTCQVCGKEENKTNMIDHIEANHMEGLALPCNMCDKTFRSRHSLRNHKSQHKI